MKKLPLDFWNSTTSSSHSYCLDRMWSWVVCTCIHVAHHSRSRSHRLQWWSSILFFFIFLEVGHWKKEWIRRTRGRRKWEMHDGWSWWCDRFVFLVGISYIRCTYCLVVPASAGTCTIHERFFWDIRRTKHDPLYSYYTKEEEDKERKGLFSLSLPFTYILARKIPLETKRDKSFDGMSPVRLAFVSDESCVCHMICIHTVRDPLLLSWQHRRERVALPFFSLAPS